jgi:hypothetical protein
MSEPTVTTVEVKASDLGKIVNLLDRKDTEQHVSEDHVPMPPHLASDFMLWLWRQSTVDDGRIALDDDGTKAQVWLEDRMVFRSTGSTKKIIVFAETHDELPEAKAAIRSDKTLAEVRVGLQVEEDLIFAFTLKGDMLSLHGLKMPSVVVDGADYQDGIEAVIEERMGLLEVLETHLAKMFRVFAEKRLSGEFENEIRQFIHNEESV